MTNEQRSSIQLEDPREAGPQPPYPVQQQELAGSD